MNPLLKILRQQRVRVILDRLREEFETAIGHVMLLKERIEDLSFEVEMLEKNDPTLPQATASARVFCYLALAWLLAVYVIDTALLRPSLEFILGLFSTGLLFVSLGIYLLPLALLAIDVGIGSHVREVRSDRQKRLIGRGEALLWLGVAAAWTSVLPISTFAAYRAGMVTQDAQASDALTLQGWALVCLALTTHGGVILAGGRIHAALALLWHSRRRRSLMREIQVTRAVQVQTLARAASLYADYEHGKDAFAKDNPGRAVRDLQVSPDAQKLLDEGSSVDNDGEEDDEDKEPVAQEAKKKTK